MTRPLELTPESSERTQRRFAAALRRRGIVAGQRIAVVSGNSLELISLVLGALRTAVVPVMVKPDLPVEDQDSLIADATVSLTLRESDIAAMLDSNEEADLAPVPLARPMHFTSGTTGAPKGVWSGILDEHDARELLAEELEQWHFERSDRHLVCAPMVHSAPLRFACASLMAGSTVYLLRKFDAHAMAEAIAAVRPTTAFVVPTHLKRYFALPDRPTTDCFRLLAHAGEPCPEPLKRRTLAEFPAGSVWEFYGSTEGQFTACSTDDWLAHPGTVGRPRPRRELTTDADDLLWCRPPRCGRFEYWNAPEKTAKAWREDGFFTVGDLGRIDDEGFVYLDSRRDDLIISGGVNVYPFRVEATLRTLPAIEDIAVFPVPDDTWGQQVCAAVVSRLSEHEITDYARAHLAPAERPKRFIFVDHIPVTEGMGKVRRSQLAHQLGLSD